MKIPFLSFNEMNASIKEELKNGFERFIDDGWYILGNRLKEFEQSFADYSHTSFCSGVGNGLDALIISLKAVGIGSGDEVIVPSNTYIATWLAVSYVGATPIPVEPRLETYNINPDLIANKITSKTKAILPVHLYGQACEMEVIMAIAKKHGLFVIEDNAQAQGATYNHQKTGSFGHINATSFYPGKNLGAFGDAGAITTNDEQLYRFANVYRNYGSEKKYYNEIKGINSRLDEMQSLFLSIKLKRLDDWNSERIKIANRYNELLQGVENIILPSLAQHATSVFHLYVIRTEKREELQNYLTQNNIGTLIHYPVPPHLQLAYSELNYKKGDFPLAEKIASTCLSLPVYPGLTDDQLVYISETIKKFFHA
ncbi:MAG: DegT/DnrJ/EryC1/StrS family aminotransferase [Bacteroidota bacterium]